MRIIEVDDVRYQVIKELSAGNEEFVEKLSAHYKDRYPDFVLLKAKPNPAVEEHHLICRRIDDADFEEIS
jgi:hypothetical protein